MDEKICIEYVHVKGERIESKKIIIRFQDWLLRTLHTIEDENSIDK